MDTPPRPPPAPTRAPAPEPQQRGSTKIPGVTTASGSMTTRLHNPRRPAPPSPCRGHRHRSARSSAPSGCTERSRTRSATRPFTSAKSAFNPCSSTYVATVELPVLLPLRKRRPHTRRRVERGNTRTTRRGSAPPASPAAPAPAPIRPAVVQLRKHRRVRRTRGKAAHRLPRPAPPSCRRRQTRPRRSPCCCSPPSTPLRTMVDQRVDQARSGSPPHRTRSTITVAPSKTSDNGLRRDCETTLVDHQATLRRGRLRRTATHTRRSRTDPPRRTTTRSSYPSNQIASGFRPTMHTFPRSGASPALRRRSCITTTPFSAPGQTGDPLLRHRHHLRLPLVVRDRKTGVTLDPGQPLLRLVENLPRTSRSER